MGTLRELSFAHQTIKGELKVDIDNSSNQFIIKLNTLDNATAIVGVPCKSVNDFKTVKVNKKIVWSNGAFLPVNDAVQYLGFKDGHLQFTLLGGKKYLIKAKK